MDISQSSKGLQGNRLQMGLLTLTKDELLTFQLVRTISNLSTFLKDKS